ncbi:polysaccharide deacetylase family protein [Ekhidna sp.]
MIRFYRTPWIIKAFYPTLTYRIPSDNKIYLTFDDGPDPLVTRWVLDELEKYGAKATFFCLGKNIEKYPELATEIVSKEHRICNHTYSHPKGWKIHDEDYISDIVRCDNVIQKIGERNNLFRPPYGRVKKSQIKKLNQYRLIIWSHLSWDFDPKLKVNRSIKKLKKAQPGSILVFHDSLRAFSNLKIILPEILNYFRTKGIQFDTIK